MALWKRRVARVEVDGHRQSPHGCLVHSEDEVDEVQHIKVIHSCHLGAMCHLGQCDLGHMLLRPVLLRPIVTEAKQFFHGIGQRKKQLCAGHCHQGQFVVWVICLGPICRQTPLHRTPPSAGLPKILLFVFLFSPQISFFILLSGGLLVELWSGSRPWPTEILRLGSLGHGVRPNAVEKEERTQLATGEGKKSATFWAATLRPHFFWACPLHPPLAPPLLPKKGPPEMGQVTFGTGAWPK